MAAGDRPDPIIPKDDKDGATNMMILIKRLARLDAQVDLLQTESDRIALLHP